MFWLCNWLNFIQFQSHDKASGNCTSCFTSYFTWYFNITNTFKMYISEPSGVSFEHDNRNNIYVGLHALKSWRVVGQQRNPVLDFCVYNFHLLQLLMDGASCKSCQKHVCLKLMNVTLLVSQRGADMNSKFKLMRVCWRQLNNLSPVWVSYMSICGQSELPLSRRARFVIYS